MMEAPLSRQRQSVFLLLSCLLNLLIVLFLIMHHIEMPNKQTLFTLIETQPEHPRDQIHSGAWAARKARSGPFGAPVIMQNPTAYSASQASPTPMQQAAASEPQHQQDTQSAPSQADVAQKQEYESAPQETESAQSVDIADTQKIKTELAEKTPEATAIKSPSKKRRAQTFKATPYDDQAETKTASAASANTRKMTLADLTQSFLEQSRDTDGNSSVTIIGDKNKTPTEDQLKHERYIEKLTWCIHNSCKINNQKKPRLNTLPSDSMQIYLALNQNGSIQDINVITSSGSPAIDAFFMHVFKDASSSFPPVPHYLPNNPYKIVYLIELRVDERNGFQLYMGR